MQEKIFIENKKGEKLAGVFHKVNDKKQVFIVCHGYESNKDKKYIVNFCKELNNAKINSFRFDFSGNGESEGKYIDKNVSTELNDLDCIINYFKAYKIGLVGFSKGGLNVILSSARNKEIKFVISIAGLASTNFLRKRVRDEITKLEKGEVFTEYREKDNKYFQITIDMINDMESYNPLEEVKKIKCPKLFIIGSNDQTLKRRRNDTENYFKNAYEPKELKIIQNGNHHFDDPQSFKDLTEYCIISIKKIKEFD